MCGNFTCMLLPPVTSESTDQFQSPLPEAWVACGQQPHHLLQLPSVVSLPGEGSCSVPLMGMAGVRLPVLVLSSSSGDMAGYQFVLKGLSSTAHL